MYIIHNNFWRFFFRQNDSEHIYINYVSYQLVFVVASRFRFQLVLWHTFEPNGRKIEVHIYTNILTIL